MIRQLRKKFIVLCMAALLVLLSMIVAGMNVINYSTVVSEADGTLSLLSKNDGVFPNYDKDNQKKHPKNMSPETPYETRYFSVLLGQDGEVAQTDVRRIKAVDKQQAAEYASEVLATGKASGFIGNYRFICCPNDEGTRIIFLDSGRKLNSFHTFLLTSISIALVGYGLFFFVIFYFSRRIIRPVAESYEKQKRFITDAGHEIKTPLTIIKADADVLEMEHGKNEWVEDIQKQAQRLTALTNDLVYLSRMEENSDSMQMIEFPVSDIVGEAASSFQTLAQAQDKVLQCGIQPMLSLTGNENAIRQLVGILLDNALKYSPAGSTVSLTLEKKNRLLQLSVFNMTEASIPKETLPLLFERFYRTDPSRNSQTGGYGIGLSVAQAIMAAHGGNIWADTEDEHSLLVTAAFPI